MGQPRTLLDFRADLDILDRNAKNLEGGAQNFRSGLDLEAWELHVKDVLGEMDRAASRLASAPPPASPGKVVSEVWWMDFKAALEQLVPKYRGWCEWVLATAPKMQFVLGPPADRGARYEAHGKFMSAAYAECGLWLRRVGHARQRLFRLAGVVEEDSAAPPQPAEGTVAVQKNDQPAGDSRSKASGGSDGAVSRGKPATVQQRMLDVIVKDPGCRGRTAQEWAEALKCSPSTVVATDIWKQLEIVRETEKVAKRKDRQRRGSSHRTE
jgi:hypothetical protein